MTSEMDVSTVYRSFPLCVVCTGTPPSCTGCGDSAASICSSAIPHPEKQSNRVSSDKAATAFFIILTSFPVTVFIIQKKRPPKKSRFVIELKPKGFNFLVVGSLCAALKETVSPYPMVLQCGANQMGCCAPTLPELP